VVARGEDGVLTGVLHVCRHPAAAVVTELQVARSSFVVRITEDVRNDGALKGMVEFEGVWISIGGKMADSGLR